MLSQETWERWISEWEKILQSATRRHWKVEPLLIHKPIPIADIENLERELQFKYPDDFKAVLSRFASGVEFYWSIEGEKPPEELKSVFSSGFYLWNFPVLHEFKDFVENISETFPNLADPYDQVWYNKAPFIHVPNGDVIAFDIVHGTTECPVVYLDHEGDDFHGKKLADNFIAFIDKWTRIYGAGPESWQMEPFYDFEKNELKSSSPIIDQWRKWLNT